VSTPHIPVTVDGLLQKYRELGCGVYEHSLRATLDLQKALGPGIVLNVWIEKRSVEHQAAQALGRSPYTKDSFNLGSFDMVVELSNGHLSLFSNSEWGYVQPRDRASLDLVGPDEVAS